MHNFGPKNYKDKTLRLSYYIAKILALDDKFVEVLLIYEFADANI